MLVRNNGKEGRNDLGQFAPGNTLQADSRPFQYTRRAEYLQSILSYKDIKDLAADESKLDEMAGIDVQIIKRLARSVKTVEPLTCADVERALEAHLDRIEGKAAQTIAHTGTIVHTQLTAEEEAETHDMLMRYQSKHQPKKEIIDVTPA